MIKVYCVLKGKPGSVKKVEYRKKKIGKHKSFV